jgi:hypothetical protein
MRALQLVYDEQVNKDESIIYDAHYVMMFTYDS